MQELLTNIGSFVAQIHWSTWVSMVIFIGFGMRGFDRGMAKELIGLGFMILAFIIAWLLYQSLSTHALITWMSLSAQSNMTIAFAVIFIAVQITKIILYKMTVTASKITDPCVLNKSFLIGFLLIATAEFSYYIDVFFNFNTIETTISEFFRSSLSFVIIFFAIIGLFVTVSKPLNISISTSYPCFLSAFIQSILDMLSSLNNKFNAINIISKNNRIFGSVVGLIKGFSFVVITILILQSIDAISYQYWLKSEGSLKIFQDVSLSIKPELSKHLLFIKND